MKEVLTRLLSWGAANAPRSGSGPGAACDAPRRSVSRLIGACGAPKSQVVGTVTDLVRIRYRRARSPPARAPCRRRLTSRSVREARSTPVARAAFPRDGASRPAPNPRLAYRARAHRPRACGAEFPRHGRRQPAGAHAHRREDVRRAGHPQWCGLFRAGARWCARRRRTTARVPPPSPPALPAQLTTASASLSSCSACATCVARRARQRARARPPPSGRHAQANASSPHHASPAGVAQERAQAPAHGRVCRRERQRRRRGGRL